MTRVLLVEDHEGIREGLRRILVQADDVVLAGEAKTAEEALKKAPESRCYVVLLDISLPGGDGFWTMQRLRTLMPELRVIMLSSYPEAQYAVRALVAGAVGYLAKESAPDELIPAIREVARGGRYVSPSFTEMLPP